MALKEIKVVPTCENSQSYAERDFKRLSLRPSVRQSGCLSVRLSVSQSICLSVSPSGWLSIFVSVSPPVLQSVSQSFLLSVRNKALFHIYVLPSTWFFVWFTVLRFASDLDCRVVYRFMCRQ